MLVKNDSEDTNGYCILLLCCRMALIQTSLPSEELASSSPSPDAHLTLSVPGQEDLQVYFFHKRWTIIVDFLCLHCQAGKALQSVSVLSWSVLGPHAEHILVISNRQESSISEGCHHALMVSAGPSCS